MVIFAIDPIHKNENILEGTFQGYGYDGTFVGVMHMHSNGHFRLYRL